MTKHYCEACNYKHKNASTSPISKKVGPDGETYTHYGTGKFGWRF